MYPERNYEMQFGGQVTSAVKNLLIANLAIFFFQFISQSTGFAGIERIFGLVPADVLGKFMIWQLVTYMFLHGGVMHILFNMFALWMFGSEIERQWGKKDFYTYYFVTGIGAGLFNILFEPGSTVPIIGASGAIYGLLLAFGMLFPNRQILIYFLFPIPAKYFVMIFGAISFMSAFSSAQDGVAHFAHLGGMVVGFLFLKTDWRSKGIFDKVTGIIKTKPKMKIHRKERPYASEMKVRIDEILDKINEIGYDKLTEEEQELLKNASKYYVNKDKN